MRVHDMQIDEPHRHRCEVRQVLRWRVLHGLAWVREWIQGVASKRGPEAAEALRSDASQQWAGGNRGAFADWR